jgi:hypothetical protein
MINSHSLYLLSLQINIQNINYFREVGFEPTFWGHEPHELPLLHPLIPATGSPYDYLVTTSPQVTDNIQVALNYLSNVKIYLYEINLTIETFLSICFPLIPSAPYGVTGGCVLSLV